MSKFNVTSSSKLIVNQARTRTTERPVSGPSFGSVLKTGANVVLRGVETAAGVVGGPLMSGAVRTARTYTEGGPIAAGLPGGRGGVGDTSASTDEGTFDQVRALQEQAQAFNLEYLAIQEEVQAENRRFSTLSNVAKARHDTVKAITQNFRN